MEHKFQKCKNHCCRPRGSGSMCNWTNLSNLFFQTFFSFFSRTSSSLNYCWTWTPEPTKMVFTFLESVLQDGEFEYFWRSVRPLEKKLYEFKTIILKIVKKIQKSSKIATVCLFWGPLKGRSSRNKKTSHILKIIISFCTEFDKNCYISPFLGF